MTLTRRGFLQALGIGGIAIAAPSLLLPERRIWQVSRTAPVAAHAHASYVGIDYAVRRVGARMLSFDVDESTELRAWLACDATNDASMRMYAPVPPGVVPGSERFEAFYTTRVTAQPLAVVKVSLRPNEHKPIPDDAVLRSVHISYSRACVDAPDATFSVLAHGDVALEPTPRPMFIMLNPSAGVVS